MQKSPQPRLGKNTGSLGCRPLNFVETDHYYPSPTAHQPSNPDSDRGPLTSGWEKSRVWA